MGLEDTFDWFRTRTATGIFAIAAFAGGLMFLNNSLTGNVILEDAKVLDALSFIGLILIVCSLILAFYAARNK